MKKTSLLLMILVFIGLQGFSQEKIITHLNKNGNLIGQAIIEIKGKTAQNIYNSSLDWVSNTFIRTKSVMQSKIENKMIRLKGISHLGNFVDPLSYQIQIDIKDGKLRFTATNLEFLTYSYLIPRISAEQMLFKPNGEQKTSKNKRELKKLTDDLFSKLLNSLVTNAEGGNKNSDNW